MEFTETEFKRKSKTGVIALLVGAFLLVGAVFCIPSESIQPTVFLAILGGLFTASGARGLRSAHQITIDDEEVVVRWRWGELQRWSRSEFQAEVSPPISGARVKIEFMVIFGVFLLLRFQGDLGAMAEFGWLRCLLPALIWGHIYEQIRGVHRAVLTGREGKVKFDLRTFADPELLEEELEALSEPVFETLEALDEPVFELLLSEPKIHLAVPTR